MNLDLADCRATAAYRIGVGQPGDEQSMYRRTLIRMAPILAAVVLAGATTAETMNAESMVTGSQSEGLIFVVSNEAGMELWRARLADKALQKISATPEQEERWPAWSNEAKRVAFIARNTVGVMHSTIKTLDVETGKESGLGPKPDFVQRSHVWAPDGKFIAHTFRAPSVEAKFITDSGTAVVNLEKATRVIVAKIESIQQRMAHLSYASDGSKIVAHGREYGKPDRDKLWILNPGVRPHALQILQRGTYATPRFMRDNESVIFDFRAKSSRPRDVMLVRLAAKSRARKVASLPKSDDYSAAPSPARNEIVFVSDRDGSPDLFLANVNGKGPPVNLTEDSDDADLEPIWSPDGERIAYIVVPEADYQVEKRNHASIKIRVIDRRGKLLFETPGVMPSWMPPWKGDQPVAVYAKEVNDVKEVVTAIEP
jgi:Tol biopolymer transport system component